MNKHASAQSASALERCDCRGSCGSIGSHGGERREITTEIGIIKPSVTSGGRTRGRAQRRDEHSELHRAHEDKVD